MDADPYPDPSFQIKAQTLRLIFHTFLACHLQIDADLDPVPDPAYHFDADPEVQVSKIRRIHADLAIQKLLFAALLSICHYPSSAL